nr:MAG TPA: hypothetical protein [Caudoviricetes sp.]
MYLNVISFKNGKTLAFQSKVPYSVDKVVDNWNLVTDEVNGQILSFRGSEIVTIATAPVKENRTQRRAKSNNKPAISTKVVEEG